MPDLTPEALAAAARHSVSAEDYASELRDTYVDAGEGLEGWLAVARYVTARMDRLAPAHAALAEQLSVMTAARDDLARELDKALKELADDKLTHAEYRQTALELLTSARAERDRYRAALEAVAREEPEEWLHEHGPQCEDESCELVELTEVRAKAREALEGGHG